MNQSRVPPAEDPWEQSVLKVPKQGQIEYLEQVEPLEDDPFPKHQGVLLSDQIAKYANHPEVQMIKPFEESSLRPAAYQLSVGRRYKLNGELFLLDPDAKRERDSFIQIPPFSVVQIETLETINLPRFLIARWNIRVDQANMGLVWVGAPQVDPGWRGRLFPPVYNLSRETVTLRYGQRFATMDFVKTTPFHGKQSDDKGLEEYSKPYKDLKDAWVSLDEYPKLVSGLSDLDEKVETVGDLKRRVEFLSALNLTILTILVAAASAAAFGDTTAERPRFIPLSPQLMVLLTIATGLLLLGIVFFAPIIGRGLRWLRQRLVSRRPP